MGLFAYMEHYYLFLFRSNINVSIWTLINCKKCDIVMIKEASFFTNFPFSILYKSNFMVLSIVDLSIVSLNVN